MQWDPRILDIHLTLAKALTEAGRIDEAEAELQMAVRIDPKNPDARANLAEILQRKGRTREAVSEYQAALALNPDWQGVLNNLAWILATDHDPQVRNGAEAVRLAERACNLASQTNLWFQHTRAAAYAEQGSFSNAVAAAQEALRLAQATGNQELAKTAASRVDHYRNSQPLRAP
jgi:Flp pilus assembly protein TadD